ncbi:MAG: RagB/SusD family nutrient uptake outer membrane protein [Bacteroidetes bacterium]|nr:RagB/SusD family nutrient uptake outer membrane protein [Bacteroidota bacterium]
MKKMTKIFWISTSVIMVVVLVGCSKFLDRKPLTATLPDVQKEQGAMEAQSLGLYNTLRTYAGFSSLPWTDFNSIRDDDAAKGSDANDGKEINAEFETFQYTKDDWATDTYWNDHYYMINLANTEIHTGRDSLKVTDPASLRQLGEAYFFRAYSYFDLVKAYGQVPLINYYYTNPADGIRPKATVDAIYAQIDGDLDTAAMWLPINASAYGNSGKMKGRLTQGAANTLWAQTYLMRQNWGKVVALCQTVINSGQYSLMPNFYDIWKDGVNGAGKNGAESIFEMNAYCGANAQAISTQNQGQDGWGTAQQVRQNGAPVAWNLGWGWNVPTDTLVKAWDNTDPRKSMTILYSGQFDGGATTGGWGSTLPAYTDPLGSGGLAEKYWNKKLYTGNDPAMRNYTGFVNGNGAAPWIDHRILRYADVILMLAEAANETGDGATAAANLELIRSRAAGSTDKTRTIVPYIAYSSQAQMRTAIKNERRWEFALEGYRFYDLVRWGDALNVLGPLGYTSRNQYYPIPQPAIDISGGVLVQNPNY